MGRYVTPAGVEIEMNDKAAAVVGYKPVAEPQAEKKAPTKKASSSKSEK